MDNFVKHLDRKTNQDNIREQASTVLAADAQFLINLWSKSSEK
jgi:hypothetical protein